MRECGLCGSVAEDVLRCTRLSPRHAEVEACALCRGLMRERSSDRAVGFEDDHSRLVTLSMRLAGEVWRVGDDSYWFSDPLTMLFRVRTPFA